MATQVLRATAINARSTLPPTIQGWEIYLDDQGNSIHTIKAFTADLRLLASYLPADQPVGGITTKDLDSFLDWMQNERGVPCSPKTFARRITSIKSFFRWLQGAGVVLADPAESVLQKSVLSPLPDALSPQEMDKVMKIADRQRRGRKPDARTYTLVSLSLHTGIKKGECLAL
jgi:integrase/recombinase XerD